MLKRTLLVTTAALSLLAAPAVAADDMKATGSNGMKTGTETETKMDTKQGESAMSGPAKPEFLAAQHDDEVRAAQLIGTRVINRQSEEIGQIADLLFDRDKGITGAVIGVGGFLGVGEKLVAVKADAVEFQQTQDNRTVAVIGTTREDLEAAPSFEPTNETYFESVRSLLRRHTDGTESATQGN